MKKKVQRIFKSFNNNYRNGNQYITILILQNLFIKCKLYTTRILYCIMLYSKVLGLFAFD